MLIMNSNGCFPRSHKHNDNKKLRRLMKKRTSHCKTYQAKTNH